MKGAIATMETGDRILFMKIGEHATEPLEEIIQRKLQEIDDVGFAFWGYGGGTCHPRNAVQPFAAASTGPIILAMNSMPSNHKAEPIRAEEFSVDKVTWTPVPEAINCVGSKYALCIEHLEQTEVTLDLSRARVAVGPSKGKLGTKYIQGRVDKACLEIVDQPEGDPKELFIGWQARLLDPYAVFLRT